MSFRMLQSTNHGFIDNATSSKPSAVPGRRLGTGKGEGRDTKPMPLPGSSERRELAHVGCVDHVKVTGLRQKVCIARGADRDVVIAEARELAGVTAW